MIRNALCLSTAHYPNPEPEFGNIRVCQTEFGSIVFPCADGEGEIAVNEFPEWIIPILKFAIENECVMIEFDRDNEVMNQFLSYDW